MQRWCCASQMHPHWTLTGPPTSPLLCCIPWPSCLAYFFAWCRNGWNLQSMEVYGVPQLVVQIWRSTPRGACPLCFLEMFFESSQYIANKVTSFLAMFAVFAVIGSVESSLRNQLKLTNNAEGFLRRRQHNMGLSTYYVSQFQGFSAPPSPPRQPLS